MTEHSILFTGPMVQAILEDRKTQTRRVILHPERLDGLMLAGEEADWCPYGGPGDRLVPRTTWATERRYDDLKPTKLPDDAAIWSYWDGPNVLPRPVGKRRPGRFLPKRFWHLLPRLPVVETRVERVQEIGEDGRKAHDVLAEGITRAAIEREEEWFHPDDAPAIAFSRLWNSINARRGYGWNVNPPVWAITFKRIKEGAPDD